MANIILLGTVIKSMGLTDIDWNRILEGNVKEKFLDINRKNLEIGMKSV